MDYFKEEKRKLILVFILVLVSGILGIFIPPFLIGKAVDALYPGAGNVEFQKLKIIISILLIIYILDNLFKLFQEYLVVGISQRIVFNIRKDLFNKFQSLPVIFF